MEEKKIICFNLLGSFSCASSAPKKVGKKTLSLLQYMIVNHARNISAEELIDTFWAEAKSSDPANALRNMLHKIRNLLKEMFPESGELLQTMPGCYAWDPELRLELDTEQFEQACIEARQHSGRESGELLRRAVSLYKGDFLSGNDSGWVRPIRQYYKTLYLDACKMLLPLLEEEEQWMEITTVCSQAYQIDFSMEEFTVCQMQAYIAMGQPEQALERYEEFKARMLKELGIPPTERVEQVRALVAGLSRESSEDEHEIFRLVCEGEEAKQAFFCSFGVFRSIVALERRHLARSGQKSTLVIVSLGDGAAPTTDVRRLERILQEGLRTGDPVARLAAGSYILMLTGTNAQDAQLVISRLDCAFHRVYRHSNARLSFRMSVLEPEVYSSEAG